MALPLLLTILTGSFAFGIAFNNYLQLTYATDAAAQLLSISRGQTTDPCNTTTQAVYSAAPNLKPASLGFTIVMDGHSFTSTSCSGDQQYLVQSQSAQVKATYPCNIQIFGLTVAPSCALTAQTTVFIQ